MEHFTRYFGVAGAALLVVWVVYDWTFLLALDRTFLEVPTTIADHVRSAILWAPPLGCALLFGVILGAASPERANRLARHGRRWFLVIRTIFVVAGAVVALMLPLTGAAIFIALLLAFLVADRALDGGASKARQVLFGGASMLLVAAAFGYLDGRQMRLSPPVGAKVLLDGKEVAVRGVRRFESATLIVDHERRVLIAPASAVTHAEDPSSTARPLVCYLFGHC
jgi:hypothetical protein